MTGATQSPSTGERLQKVLARAGFGSRRQCESLIAQGRVTVDGRVVDQPGLRVDSSGQKIAVDGERVRSERLVYYLLNKPRGVLSTNYDPSGRPRVIDLVGRVSQRLFSVGRLDKESEGLLLLTNDGELANRLAHPKYCVPKTYVVQVAGCPKASELAQIRRGVHLAGGRVAPESVRRIGTQGRSTFLQIVLSEGQNREIRRMLARLGQKVMRLRRVRIGPLADPGLKSGQFRKLRLDEIRALERCSREPRSRQRPKRSTQRSTR